MAVCFVLWFCCGGLVGACNLTFYYMFVDLCSVINLSCICLNTSGYAMMVHGRGCNPHRCTTTFAKVEITSLWRHKSETIRDRQKRRPHFLSYSMVKTASLYDNFCKTGNYVIYDIIILVQDGNCKKWLERILVFVRCTIKPKISTIRSSFLGVTQPAGVAQLLSSRGHN